MEKDRIEWHVGRVLSGMLRHILDAWLVRQKVERGWWLDGIWKSSPQVASYRLQRKTSLQ